MAQIIACVRWRLGLAVLEQLAAQHEIVAVVSDGPEATNPYKRLVFEFCQARRLRFFDSTDPNWERVFDVTHDVTVVAGFNKKISDPSRARSGILVVHQSLVPMHGGKNPLLTAARTGQKDVGLTLYKLDDASGVGPVYFRAQWPLDLDISLRSLVDQYIRIMPAALDVAIASCLAGSQGLPESGVAARSDLTPSLDFILAGLNIDLSLRRLASEMQIRPA